MASVDGGFITGTSPIDNLLVGEHFTDTVTLDQNQTLTRGAVLGVITGSGLAILSLSAAIDGSEVPAFVLLRRDAVTGGAETLDVEVMTHGQVNEEALNFGAGHDKDSVKAPLRDVGIHLVSSSPA